MARMPPPSPSFVDDVGETVVSVKVADVVVEPDEEVSEVEVDGELPVVVVVIDVDDVVVVIVVDPVRDVDESNMTFTAFSDPPFSTTNMLKSPPAPPSDSVLVVGLAPPANEEAGVMLYLPPGASDADTSVTSWPSTIVMVSSQVMSLASS